MSDKPKMNLLGMDGNIFVIMANASQLLNQNGQSDKAQEMRDRVTMSNSYDEALCIISEYVETELSLKPTKTSPKKGKSAYDR